MDASTREGRPGKRARIESPAISDDTLLNSPKGYASRAVSSGDMATVERLIAQMRTDKVSDDTCKYIARILHISKRYDMVVKLLETLTGGIRNCLGLRIASNYGYFKFVERFLTEPEVDPNIGSPFAHAVRNGHVEVALLLLSDPRTDPTFSDNTAFCWAVHLGLTALVEAMLADDRVDPSAQSNFAIGKAAACNKVDIVKLLLANRNVNPGDKFNFALRVASKLGHNEIVCLLLNDTRVDPNEEMSKSEHSDLPPALVAAVRGGHYQVVKTLLAHASIDPNVGHGGAITAAIERGDRELVRLILRHERTTTNFRDGFPLRVAIKRRQFAIVKDLVTRTDLQHVVQNKLHPQEVNVVRRVQQHLYTRHIRPALEKSLELKTVLQNALGNDVLAKISAFAWGSEVVANRSIGCWADPADSSTFTNAEHIFKLNFSNI